MNDNGPGEGNMPELIRIEAALAGVREACARLAEENRTLRQDPGRPAGADAIRLRAAEHRLAQLEEENQELHRELAALSGRGAIREQESLLANLYVAGFNLHRTLELDAVLASVKEILINLVGAERFQIFVLDGDRRTLIQIADEGSPRPALRRVPLGEGIAGVVAKTGIPYFEAGAPQGDFQNPLACVPMQVDGQVIGVIQVSRLFVQKARLTGQDHELFSLLAETAGTALLAATLRQRALQDEGCSRLEWSTLLIPCLEIQDGPPAVGPEHGGLPGEADQTRATGRSN